MHLTIQAHQFFLLLVLVNKCTPWPDCQLLTNRRCPESLADVVASINTIWQSILWQLYVLTVQISIVRKDETTPTVITLVNKRTLDNKPHLSCCGVISACAYIPDSMDCWSTVLIECWDTTMLRFEIVGRLSISNSVGGCISRNNGIQNKI